MIDNPMYARSWPRAILHIDCDAFFASCEQAIHPEYRGKPVITGKERGIVAAASYEAKAKGVKRGVKLWEVKRMCPDAIIVPSDYETYSLFSKRMFEIIRRFTPLVEEYSIDEAFAEITGFRRTYHASYETIAKKIKSTIESELGITVSVGLSVSKVLAKVASKWEKPAGLTVISGKQIHEFLRDLPVDDLWGIGARTAAFCKAHGMYKALQFAQKDFGEIRRLFTKPHHEMWHELNGQAIYNIETEEKHDYQTIGKTKTFTPPSRDPGYVFAQLTKNLENACIKARRHGLLGQTVVAFVKSQDFKTRGFEVRLSRASAYPHEIIPLLKPRFAQMFDSRVEYRSTGVILGKLQSEDSVQMTLFESPIKVDAMMKIYEAIDDLAAKMGKHRVYMGASALAHQTKQHLYDRGDIPVRKMNRLKGESSRLHLPIPVLMQPTK